MSKITIEIEDTLQDRVDSAIEDVKDELLRYCEDSEPDKVPDLGNDLDYSGGYHEIIDSSVPIYNKEIDDIFYLHGRDVEAAFDDAGIGSKEDEGWPSGWRPAAIYCYIDQAVREWYDDHAEDIFEEWQAKHRAKKLAGIEIFEVTAGDFLNAEAGSWQFEIIDTEVKRLNSEGFYGEDRIREIIEDTAKASAGFYWWSCQPGCLPDGEANGPFETSEEAEEDVLSN
jgi:hypothetical protein